MEQASFYLIADRHEEAILQFACRLLQKINRLGQSVYVITADQAQAGRLNEQLWRFEAESFVPHNVVSPDELGSPEATARETEIVISWQAEPFPSCPSRSVVLNLSSSALPEPLQHCPHLTNICRNDPADISALRLEYKRLQSTGVTPKIHDMRPPGHRN